jgi:hypothetical protein
MSDSSNPARGGSATVGVYHAERDSREHQEGTPLLVVDLIGPGLGFYEKLGYDTVVSVCGPRRRRGSSRRWPYR